MDDISSFWLWLAARQTLFSPFLMACVPVFLCGGGTPSPATWATYSLQGRKSSYCFLLSLLPVLFDDSDSGVFIDDGR